MPKLCKKSMGSKSDIQSDDTFSSDFKFILKKLIILKFEQYKLMNLVNRQNSKLDSFEQKFTKVFYRTSFTAKPTLET